MKSKIIPLVAGHALGRRQGVTLVEAMIAMLIFAILSIGVTTSLVKLRKQGEENISESIALAMAEGVMDQIRRMDYATLSTVTNPAATPATTAVPVELKLISVTTDNKAAVQTFNLDWAPDGGTFTLIGVRVDPTDPTSEILGVLLDVDHKNTSTGAIIKPRRYMKMQVNLTKTVDMDNGGMVALVLKYKWALASRKSNAGGPIYSTAREIRSVVSKMPTY